MAESNHRTTGSGTHKERVFKYREDIKAAKKQASYLEGKRDFFKKVPIITNGSKFNVETVDERESDPQNPLDALVDARIDDMASRLETAEETGVIDVEAVSVPITE